jgi:hypothetical protein
MILTSSCFEMPAQFVNNIIRRVAGAGMGVWGCYNCLYAYNTLVSVGNRSHTVEVKFGERSCDGGWPG